MRFSGAQRSVVDGPFAETKELVAGFWLWRVRSMAEAMRRGRATGRQADGVVRTRAGLTG